MEGKNRENYNKNYIAYVNSFAPKTNHFKNCLRAFLVGGLICCIGQFFRYMLEIVFHLSGDELAGSVSVLLIFLGTLLTGLGVYDRIGRNAGAGSIVPITALPTACARPPSNSKRKAGYTAPRQKCLSSRDRLSSTAFLRARRWASFIYCCRNFSAQSIRGE